MLRHASIRTTANVYMPPIPASIGSAINSRTKAIFQTRNQVDSSKTPTTTVPNGFKFEGGVSATWQIAIAPFSFFSGIRPIEIFDSSTQSGGSFGVTLTFVFATPIPACAASDLLHEISGAVLIRSECG